MKTVKFTWAQYDKAIRFLANKINSSGMTSKIKYIYGIPRGGLVVAVSLSHALELNLVTELPEEDSDWGRTLVVDDIADTGRTMGLLMPLQSATIHYTGWSTFKPNFWFAMKEKDTWILYPWEVGVNGQDRYRKG